MIVYRNARVINTECPGCKEDAHIFNGWREQGGEMPLFTCKIDHRPVCGDCGEASDDLKFCKYCKANLETGIRTQVVNRKAASGSKKRRKKQQRTG